MTTPVTTQITSAVVTALQAIQTTGGYHTNAGDRVFRGRSEHLEDTEYDRYPLIRVRSSGDSLAEQRPGLARITRNIEIQGVISPAQEDYEPELDQLVEDIFTALLPLTKNRGPLQNIGHQAQFAEMAWTLEGDAGMVTATFRLTVAYILQI